MEAIKWDIKKYAIHPKEFNERETEQNANGVNENQIPRWDANTAKQRV